jgi:ABC-type amino acid transport substrate-binding protein
LLIASNASAQKDSSRVFSVKEPLVYVDAVNWWPYAFLDEAGEPDGYNIELVRLLLNELHIPYIIKLKPRQEVIEDMKTGRADLTIGLASGFYDDYMLLGNNVIMLLTQSVATPKSKPVEIKTFRDLGRPGAKVMVGENSFCHRLMTDYGWSDQAIIIRGIKENLKLMNEHEDGQMVSNTLLLKWLIRDLKLENIGLTPVDMPHGALKFRAHNRKLLNALDKTYAQLYATDELEPLERKWFYPEDEGKRTP